MTDDFSGGRTGQPWTAFEIDATVAAYLEMVAMERRGERYRKVDVVGGLMRSLPARSRRAIEQKFQNISWILDEEGCPFIQGYRGLSHYQRELREALVAALARDRRIGEMLATYGSTAVIAPQRRRLATDDVLVTPPGADGHGRRSSSVGLVGGTIPAMHDFRTRQLGTAGEEWVVDLERERFRRRGRDDLADRVTWISHDLGDGAGFDVASFFPDGRERLIEVKTTNYSVGTPFYITRWEVDVSDQHPDAYSLYRVHGFSRDPRLYVLDGSIAERVRLDPKVFLGIPI